MNPHTSAGSSTVLVLGANGRFGQAACEAFAHAGWQVLAQTRRELHWRTAHTSSRIHCVTGELNGLSVPGGLSGRDGLHSLDESRETELGKPDFEKVSVIVNALNPIYTRWQRDALPLARAAMDLAQRLNATLMFPGNAYNFGKAMPELLTEDTPQRAQTRKGKIRVRIESELHERAARGLQTVIVRAGDFFGTGLGSWFDLSITKDLNKALLTYPGDRDLIHAWAYLPDLAKCFVALAERRRYLSTFEVFHFEGHALTGKELLGQIETAARTLGLFKTGTGITTRTLPWTLMQVAAIASPMLRELVEMKYLWDTPHRLIDTRLREVLGEHVINAQQTALSVAIERTLRLSFHKPASTNSAMAPVVRSA
jgi:nucleoside-diphosphate-sugar epimerase